VWRLKVDQLDLALDVLVPALAPVVLNRARQFVGVFARHGRITLEDFQEDDGEDARDAGKLLEGLIVDPAAPFTNVDSSRPSFIAL
jgi:hypothetical protein